MKAAWGRAVRDRRRERLTAAAIGIGAALFSWLLAAATGAAGIARTDDWAYARVAFTLHRTGSLRLVGWGQMTLVGLAVWAQPWLIALGDHTWVLDLSARASPSSPAPC